MTTAGAASMNASAIPVVGWIAKPAAGASGSAAPSAKPAGFAAATGLAPGATQLDPGAGFRLSDERTVHVGRVWVSLGGNGMDASLPLMFEDLRDE